MKFICFYTILLFFTQGIWKIACSADFNTLELDHLAKKLHPLECMKLLEAMQSSTPLSTIKDEKDSVEFQSTLDYCRIKLGEWNRSFPGKENKIARAHLEKALRTIGRPELANYVKRSKRLVDILNNVIHTQKSRVPSKYEQRRETLAEGEPNKSGKHKKSFSQSSAHGAGKIPQAKHLVMMGASQGAHYRQELKKQAVTSENTKDPPKEVRLQNFGGVKAEAMGDTSGSQHSDHHPSFEDSSTTRWIAIGIFILLIITLMLITALIAMYKNRRCMCPPWDSTKIKNKCDDRCPLTNHFQRPSDIERGWATSSTDYMGTRWRRASSLTSSRSSSLISQEKKKKIHRVKRHRDKQQQAIRLEKKRKSKENKDKKKRESKESNKQELSFRDRIINILKKDKQVCKCCKCSLAPDESQPLCHCASPDKKISKKPKKPSKERGKSKDRKESKDRRRSSLESSPRERRDSRLKEVFARMKDKSPRLSLDRHDHVEPCTRQTCDARKSPRDRNSVDFDDTYHSDHLKVKK